MADDDLDNYSPKEGEREKRREKKRRPRMQISGRSVIGLAQMIVKRAQRAKTSEPVARFAKQAVQSKRRKK